MGPVLILGATSTIAKATADAFAKQGRSLFLAGRNQEELKRMASDLHLRHGIEVKWGTFDADQINQHAQFVQHAVQEMKGLDGVLLAFGSMGDHQKSLSDVDELQNVIHRNFTGACSLLHACANYFEEQQKGFMMAISSVAGDRGRQSNYVYGSAKGGLTLFLQGLRNRLHQKGVRVITIEPGFVDTPMTYGKEGMFLVASPKYVGGKIVDSLDKSSDIVYIPWFWRYIMWIIKLIPERIFKRLKL